jgi:hypothetical protein
VRYETAVNDVNKAGGPKVGGKPMRVKLVNGAGKTTLARVLNGSLMLLLISLAEARNLALHFKIAPAAS